MAKKHKTDPEMSVVKQLAKKDLRVMPAEVVRYQLQLPYNDGMDYSGKPIINDDGKEIGRVLDHVHPKYVTVNAVFTDPSVVQNGMHCRVDLGIEPAE